MRKVLSLSTVLRAETISVNIHSFLNGNIHNIAILKKNSVNYRLIAMIKILEMLCSALLILNSHSMLASQTYFVPGSIAKISLF